MVEFENGTRGMAPLNLETDNVGIVIFGADREIKEGQHTDRQSAPAQSCAIRRLARACWEWSMRSAIRSSKVRSVVGASRVDVKAPGHNPAQIGQRADWATRPQAIDL